MRGEMDKAMSLARFLYEKRLKQVFVEKVIILKKIYDKSNTMERLIQTKTDGIETRHVYASPYKSYR